MQKHETHCLPNSPTAAIAAGSHVYYTGVPCVRGHDTYRYVVDRICAACAKEKVARAAKNGGNARRWAAKTKEQRAAICAKRRAYYAKTAEAQRTARREAHAAAMQDPEKKAARRAYVNAKRAAAGPRKDTGSTAAKAAYKKRNVSKTRALDAKRHAAQMQRTPAWLTADDFWMMEQAYELAQVRTKMFGFTWHVDHVVPLQGKRVSGLHVPTNLQVISKTANRKKANKYEVA